MRFASIPAPGDVERAPTGRTKGSMRPLLDPEWPHDPNPCSFFITLDTRPLSLEWSDTQVGEPNTINPPGQALGNPNLFLSPTPHTSNPKPQTQTQTPNPKPPKPKPQIQNPIPKGLLKHQRSHPARYFNQILRSSSNVRSLRLIIFSTRLFYRFI